MTEPVRPTQEIIEIYAERVQAQMLDSLKDFLFGKDLRFNTIATEMASELGIDPRIAGTRLYQRYKRVIEQIMQAAPVDAPIPLLMREPVGAFSDADIDDVEHLIDPLLPRGFVTLFSSHGGGGKTNLALTWAAHIACGVCWAGLPTQTGKVLFVTLEDPLFVVQLRLRRIARRYLLSWTAIEQNVEIISLSEVVRAALAVDAVVGGIKTLNLTRVYDAVRDAAVGFDLVIIDNASDAYHGGENTRADVNQFIRTLAIEIGRRPDSSRHTAILLLAHIDKAAARSGGGDNDYSGSTAWHNSTRSRIALLPVSDDDEAVKLVHQKSNFRKRHADIPLAWVNKVLVPTSLESVSDAKADRMLADDDAVFNVVRAAIQRGRTVTATLVGHTTAFTTLELMPEFPDNLKGKDGKKRTHTAIERLIKDRRLTKEEYTNEYYKAKWRLRVAENTRP